MLDGSSCGSGFDCGDTSGWAVSGLEMGPVRYPFFLDRSNARRKQSRSLLGGSKATGTKKPGYELDIVFPATLKTNRALGPRRKKFT